MRSIAIALVVWAVAFEANASINAGGVYDENTVAANMVDRSATFLGGTGAGDDQGLVPGVRSFSTSVAAAYESGFGGVVDFESGALDTSNSFSVFFNAGARSVTFSQNTSSGYSIKNYIAANRTPISGTKALAKDPGSPDFEFDVVSLNGGDSAEHVVELGLTLLGRNNSNARSEWTGIASISNLKGDTGTITNQVSNLNSGSGNATDDVFFGFRAPAGYFIKSVTIHSDTGAFTSLDDLGFVTAMVTEAAAASPAHPPATTPAQPLPSSVTEPKPPQNNSGVEWWIVAALAMIIVLLFAVIWMLRRPSQSSSMLPARIPATTPSTAGTTDVQTTGIPAELTEFAKQSLVQGLYSQRQMLIETQKRAQQQLAELENRLGDLQLPFQGRIRAYEERINVLEKELASKDESMRELTRATLMLVRQKLEEEKEREKNFNRFS